jgi:hypothetical protein
MGYLIETELNLKLPAEYKLYCQAFYGNEGNGFVFTIRGKNPLNMGFRISVHEIHYRAAQHLLSILRFEKFTILTLHGKLIHFQKMSRRKEHLSKHVLRK